ncbi:glycosyltransferase family 2 protein [Halanaerobaculum tunisiense]
MNNQIIALLPAYNEEERISSTIQAVAQIELVDEVIVVDDGSTDNTCNQAKEAGARTFHLATNQGKGAALNYGLERIRGDIILLLDADLEESAREAKKLVAPVMAGEADMAIGKFPPAKKQGGCGLVKGLANWGLEQMTKQEFQTPLSGQRAVTWEVIEEINGFATGFGVEVALTIDAHQAGFEIIEVPVQMSHRETGRDLAGFWHRGKQFKDILQVLQVRM